jgi:arylsulfatase A-like enzyme
MKNLCVILTLILLTLSPCLAKKPNVIVFLTDDQGWGDLSLHGNYDLHTPNIDSLARDGASFDRFYVQPVCAPTRAEFLTGRYHPRGNVFGVTLGGERLNLDEVTVANLFSRAGYGTAAFGKWHNGTQYPYHPNGRGFQEYYGFCSGHWGNYFNPLLEHNSKPVKGEGFIIDDLTSKAIDYIKTNREKPFFVYLPYCTPHSPMQVPEEYWKKFENMEVMPSSEGSKPADIRHTRAALAMCENIDWNIGRVLHSLKEMQLEEDTIVLYFSDNGPNGFRWNGGMRGKKGSTDEGGVRSPLLVRWKGTIPAGTYVDEVAGAIDLLPTLTDLAGVSRKGTKPLDGKSLKGLLLGRKAGKVFSDRYIYAHWANKVSVRSKRYRLDFKNRLYDMLLDPNQTVDVKNKHQELHLEMVKAKESWKSDVMGEDWRSERPFTIGNAKYSSYLLPARDAQFTGGIERSARAPNCSFLTNWSSTEDTIFYDVIVEDDGVYDVDLHYTCAPGDVGIELSLSVDGNEVKAKVTEAHHPALSGQEHDRYPRNSESYVKTFKSLAFSGLTLKKGPKKLVLKAHNKTGKGLVDVRLLHLKRQL